MNRFVQNAESREVSDALERLGAEAARLQTMLRRGERDRETLTVAGARYVPNLDNLCLLFRSELIRCVA